MVCRCLRIRRLLTWGALSVSVASPASVLAQTSILLPEAAQPLVVEIEVTKELSLPKAGTLLGWRGDTLFVATAAHNLRDAASICARVRGQQNVCLPSVLHITLDELDLAIIAVIGHRALDGWKVPRVVERRDPESSAGQPVFALGCASGECWHLPEEARLVHADTGRYKIRFRSPYLRPGFSGGPLVDTDGALLGIILADEEVTGEALRWDVVAYVAKVAGISPNLQHQPGFRIRDISVRWFGTVNETGAYDADGTRLLGSYRLEGAYRTGIHTEIVVGYTRSASSSDELLPIDIPPTRGNSYIRTFWALGFRKVYALRGFQIGRELPDAVGWGIDLLLPTADSASAVLWSNSDSTDYHTGGPLYSRRTASIDARTSMALYGEYRVGLHEFAFLSFSPLLQFLNAGETGNTRLFVNLGAGIRWPR